MLNKGVNKCQPNNAKKPTKKKKKKSANLKAPISANQNVPKRATKSAKMCQPKRAKKVPTKNRKKAPTGLSYLFLALSSSFFLFFPVSSSLILKIFSRSSALIALALFLSTYHIPLSPSCRSLAPYLATSLLPSKRS